MRALLPSTARGRRLDRPSRHDRDRRASSDLTAMAFALIVTLLPIPGGSDSKVVYAPPRRVGKRT